MENVSKRLAAANSIILSTHIQPDGDGLGAQLALYWALKKMGKKVRIINVDQMPRKYDFLDRHQNIEVFEKPKLPVESTDLVMIFDTNDPELLPGLWDVFEKKAKSIVFVDHHPVLERFPLKMNEHLIDVTASSTGEIVFNLIKSIGVAMDAQIALPLYASIVFDTHYFRYIRNSATPHLMAAELLRHNINPQQVHRHLFGNQSITKLKYLSKILGHVEYELGGRLACVHLKKKELKEMDLELDDTRDIIDMVMNVESIEAAVLFREDSKNTFKLSFRSKGQYIVNELAENLGGGGHRFASGALITGDYQDIKESVLNLFEKLFNNGNSNHSNKVVNS